MVGGEKAPGTSGTGPAAASEPTWLGEDPALQSWAQRGRGEVRSAPCAAGDELMCAVCVPMC